MRTATASGALPCPHGDEVAQAIAAYMAGEMNRNALSPITRKIAEANRYDPAEEMRRWQAQPWYAKAGGMPDFHAAAAGIKTAAYGLWAERVGPGRPWDHKPILEAKLSAAGTFNHGWHKYGGYDYFYDIWSNIHYGYVGRAAGFSTAELINGAGLAQMASDIVGNLRKGDIMKFQNHSENGEWPASADDTPDHISIKLGCRLYNEHKAGAMNAEALLVAISSVPAPWGSGGAQAKEIHQCG
ncbi:polymorphic toxin type 44 domain-containing protein [Pseudomonas alcaligenes]|uniref:polymorphic toxin type 44 domain-containing protein n=1 Tax=Pseudomonas sp. RIT-PI-AD TaxID=3035294 RepID=UPI0021DB380F